jgi:hypothetical protein
VGLPHGSRRTCWRAPGVPTARRIRRRRARLSRRPPRHDSRELSGPHALGAYLADGWYRGQVGLLRAADEWGTETAFLAQLHLEYDDGSTTVVGTDGSWRWAESRILAADLIDAA